MYNRVRRILADLWDIPPLFDGETPYATIV